MSSYKWTINSLSIKRALKETLNMDKKKQKIIVRGSFFSVLPRLVCPIHSTAGSVVLKYPVLYETSKLHNIQRIEMGESSRIQLGQKKQVFTNTKALK